MTVLMRFFDWLLSLFSTLSSNCNINVNPLSYLAVQIRHYKFDKVTLMAGLSIWHVLIFAIVVLLLFGTSKLKNLGKDVGGAVKDFKKSIKDEDELSTSINASMNEPRTIEHQNKPELNTNAKH
mgnify:FL=1